jgi:hypothetical protein
MSDTTGATGAATSAADLLGGGTTSTTATTTTDGGTTTGATTTGAEGTATTATTEKPSWIDTLDDPELKGWAQNKGYREVKDLATAHRGLEGLLSREKLPLPKDEADAEGWNRVYSALGRPDDKGGYKLSEIANADPEFADAAGDWFHEAGLNAKQAGVLAEKWNAHQEAVVAKMEADFQAKSGAEMSDLKTEWGPKFDANTELARRGAKMLGWDKDTMSGVERVLGTKGMMTALSKIGGGMAEDSFIDGEGRKTFGMTPDQAQARLNTLKADKEWGKKYLNGDADARAEVERLNRIISGTPLAA